MKKGLMEPNILPIPEVHPTPRDLIRVGKLSEQMTIKDDHVTLIAKRIMITAAIMNGFPAKKRMNSIMLKNRSPKIAILFRPPSFFESMTKVTRIIATTSTL